MFMTHYLEKVIKRRKNDELGISFATELAAKIRGGAISAIALTEYFIERIERFDKDINAVVVKTF